MLVTVVDDGINSLTSENLVDSIMHLINPWNSPVAEEFPINPLILVIYVRTYIQAQVLSVNFRQIVYFQLYAGM